MQKLRIRLIVSNFILCATLLLSLSACGPGDYYQVDPTRIAGFARQSTQQALSSRAESLERVGQQAEATAQAAYDTAEGIRAAQQATQAEVERRQVVATQTAYEFAQKQAEERAWLVTGWTATASSAQATGTVVVQQTVQAATAVAIQADQERTRLALEQQRTFNDLMGALRFLIPTLLLIVIPLVVVTVFVYAVVVFVRSRRNTWGAVYPAANGDKPLLAGGRVYIDPDRAAGPIIDPSQPYDIPLDQQLQLVAGDQRVDATRAMPRVITQNILPVTGQPFQIVDENQRPPTALLPDPDVDHVLDGDWKEA